MALNNTQITVAGNLTKDPIVRVLNSGDAVVNFTVAVTPRMWDSETKQYKDGEATYYKCTAFKQLAENAGESLKKGSRVLVVGNHKMRSWESQDGKRTDNEITVEEVGPSLQYATVDIKRRGGSNTPPVQQTQAAPEQSPESSNPFQ